MNGSIFNKRAYPRYLITSPIQFAPKDTESILPAKMLNISDGGMYFESDHLIHPKTDVFVWLGGNLTNQYQAIQLYDFYRGKVCWCTDTGKGSILGIGIQHVIRSRIKGGPEYICNLCEDKIPLGKVEFVNDFIYLCPVCHSSLKTSTGREREEIFRFLEGNVF